jgi:hypothetical protein
MQFIRRVVVVILANRDPPAAMELERAIVDRAIAPHMTHRSKTFRGSQHASRASWPARDATRQ